MHYHFGDRILEIDAHGAGTILVEKSFPRTEDYFQGTFRSECKVPASLVLETMVSAGSFLLAIRSGYRMNALLLKVARATFPGEVLAGDRFTVRSRLEETQGDWGGAESPGSAGALAQMRASGFVSARCVAEADVLYLCVPMAATLGPKTEEILTRWLELVGRAENRP